MHTPHDTIYYAGITTVFIRTISVIVNEISAFVFL